MADKQQILLIHWWDTHTSYDEFLSWLKEKSVHLEWLASRRDWKNELQFQLWDDYIVYTPQMPNKQNAQYIEWEIMFNKLLDAIDDNFILIGHSLWAAFVVKYLSENKINKKIKKTMLLWTPFNGDMDGDKLTWFTREWDISNLSNQAWELYFYHSEDDFAVPYSHVLKFQEILPEAHYRLFKDRNHFLQWEVPELISDIIS
jgi:predicted alpha/beta hydrolase family esterase